MSMWQDLAIKTRDISGPAVTYEKAKTLLQSGTGTPPYTAAYKTFTTAYGTPPIVEVEVIGPLNMTRGSLILDTPTISKGSFSWTGSPALYARWRSLGFL